MAVKVLSVLQPSRMVLRSLQVDHKHELESFKPIVCNRSVMCNGKLKQEITSQNKFEKIFPNFEHRHHHHRTSAEDDNDKDFDTPRTATLYQRYHLMLNCVGEVLVNECHPLWELARHGSEGGRDPRDTNYAVEELVLDVVRHVSSVLGKFFSYVRLGEKCINLFDLFHEPIESCVLLTGQAPCEFLGSGLLQFACKLQCILRNVLCFISHCDRHIVVRFVSQRFSLH